uniref:Uncharacterized protein n=1 Tax=Tetranychus urticae TaxID=32264 RepID=T1L6K6_TETUR
MTHKSYGRLLTVSGCASIEIDPSIPEASHLSDWYATNGDSIDAVSLTVGIFGDISSISSWPSDVSADEVFYTNLEVIITSCTGQVYKACTDTEPALKDQVLLQKETTDVPDFEDDLSPLLEVLIGRKFRFNIKTRQNIYHTCNVQHSFKSFSEVISLGDEELYCLFSFYRTKHLMCPPEKAT